MKKKRYREDEAIEFLSECNALEDGKKKLWKPTLKDLIFFVFFYYSKQFKRKRQKQIV